MLAMALQLSTRERQVADLQRALRVRMAGQHALHSDEVSEVAAARRQGRLERALA